MAALVRSTDWSATALGPIECWPLALRIALDMVLAADVPMAIDWGPQFIVLYNDAYIACLGPRHPAALGQPTAQVWPEAWNVIEPELQRVMRRGQSVPFADREFVLEHNGQLQSRWFTGCFSPIRDESACVVGVLNPTIETTSRVLALRENARLLAQARGTAQQLQQMFEQAPGFMAVHRGPEHVFELCNEGFLQLFGQRDIVGKTPRQVFPDTEGQGFYELLDRVYTSGESFIGHAMPVKLQQAPGASVAELYVDLLYQPLRDSHGKVWGIFQLGHDVTEQHRAIVALRDSEQRFRLLAERSSAGAFSWDVVNAAVLFPRGTREVFGFGDEPIDAARVFASIHREDLPAVQAAVAGALDPAGRGECRVSYRVVHSDGSVRWVDSVGQAQFEPLADGTRRAVHIAGVIWDVTDYRNLVEQLRESDARKDEFLAMLAHELRNPLAPLTNAHRLIERTQALDERGRTTLALAERQTRQLHRLVDDLLEVSRVSRGQIALKCEPMMVATAIYNAVESVAAAIETRNQSLRVAIPERPVRIVADPPRIAQVLENLLTNASKYTPAGGSIRIEVEDRADTVEIRVVDDGIGIEPAKIGQLFELFHQIDATLDRSAGGLGIGLALVKRLVELHGGSVRAASEGLGRGATFTVRLPHGNAS